MNRILLLFIASVDTAEKKEGLDLIMLHLTGKNPPYAEGMVDKVNVYKLSVRSISGKRNNG